MIVCIVFVSMPFLGNHHTLILYEARYYNVSVDSRGRGNHVKPSLQTNTTNTSHRFNSSTLLFNTTIKAIASEVDLKIPICTQPKTKVAFLKVHKAGSTTVMNIFLRFGVSHNLNIVLPRTTSQTTFNYIGYGETIQESRIIRIPDNETFDILCNHVVYNKEAFQRVLGPDAVNIGIIRDPFTQFPSAALYYGITNQIRKRFGVKIDDQRLLSTYLYSPDLFGHTVHTHNGMFFDFGLPTKQFYNESAINNHIVELDKDFALIMLVEFFDESLVLMKKLLCWDLKDILYVPLNINKRKEKNPIVLSEEDKQNLFKYNYADFKLYLYFRNKLLRQIKNAGKDFNKEVNHFQTVQSSVTQYCHVKQKAAFSGSDVFTVPSSSWNQDFVITPSECKFMMQSELPLLKELIKKADERYDQWWTDTHNESVTPMLQTRTVIAK